jgi:hypothetical protein
MIFQRAPRAAPSRQSRCPAAIRIAPDGVFVDGQKRGEL